MYLLCISGLDDTENRKIYETYMHFGQISDNGKQSHGLILSNLEMISSYITRVTGKV